MEPTPPVRRRTSLAALILFTIATLLLLLGCERQYVAPPLVEVTELAPHDIEPGDRLEVHGTGFPQGRAGKVVLDGAIFRPGEPPRKNERIEVDGTVVTPDRLEIVVRDSFAERFCGRGDRAAHGTFRGDVFVSFASNNPGAPPLTGVLRNTTLDVQPSSARAASLDARTKEGTRLLEFLGLTVGAPTPRGLPIEQVKPGSFGERAQLLVGDVIVAVDGVHVLNLGDIVPASARSADLTIRHGDTGTEETKTVSLIEYSGERVPMEYAPALVIVGLAIAVLLILVLPGPPSLATLEARIAARARRATLRSLLAGMVGGGKNVGFFVLVSAALASFALTPYLIAREVDGVVLLACAACLLVWSRVAAEKGALRSVKTLLEIAIAVVAMSGALALAVVQVGAIDLTEIVRTQGAAPWQWHGSRHPSCAVLAIVFVVTLTTILRTRPATDDDSPRPMHALVLERAGLMIASALFVIAFAGGWQSGVDKAGPSIGASLIAALILITKTWVVSAVVLAASTVMSTHASREAMWLVMKKVLPSLVLGAGLIAASRFLVRASLLSSSEAIEKAFGATLVAIVVLFSIRLIARVRQATTRPEPHASPFL